MSKASVAASSKSESGHRTSSHGASVTEKDLLQKDVIGPEDVLKLTKPTEGYLCSKEANIYNVEFTRLRMRDMADKKESYILDVKEDKDVPKDADAPRLLQYVFPYSLLSIDNIGALIEFRVEKEIKDFRMVERHFFNDTCLKTFDFKFGFCMPNSTNSCEHIYDMPKLNEKLKKDMLQNPKQTKSDSFYFANGKLIMHHKAVYSYYDGQPPLPEVPKDK